jgi:hypothetical protein
MNTLQEPIHSCNPHKHTHNAHTKFQILRKKNKSKLNQHAKIENKNMK